VGCICGPSGEQGRGPAPVAVKTTTGFPAINLLHRLTKNRNVTFNTSILICEADDVPRHFFASTLDPSDYGFLGRTGGWK
jgi:hypothetical protein